MSNNVDYSIHYRRWHSGTIEELSQVSRTYDRWIGEEVRKYPQQAKVLDYGCGFGALVYFLKMHFDDVLGVDASKAQVDMARSNGLPVDLVPLDEFSLWCNDYADKFDVIFLFDVLEHIPVLEQIRFMRMLTGTLKPNGVIYIKVPNANSLLASRWRYIDWTHCSSFTECSLDFVCLNSGLIEIEYIKDESSLKPRYWWVPRWGLKGFYIKSIFRAIWRHYLKSELGSQADTIRVGYNLFARARKGR